MKIYYVKRACVSRASRRDTQRRYARDAFLVINQPYERLHSLSATTIKQRSNNKKNLFLSSRGIISRSKCYTRNSQ